MTANNNIPPQGLPAGTVDFRNPTLVPNFDTSVASANGTVDHKSPARFLADNPRVNSVATALLAGTATPTDVVTLTITLGTLPGGSKSFAYTVASGDTLDAIAEGLADLINNDATAQAAGIEAQLGGTGEAAVVEVLIPGRVGNQAVLSSSLSGGATEVVWLGSGSTFLAFASATATIGGTETDGDTVGITFTNTGVAGLPVTVNHVTSGGESVSSIATALKTAINANSTLNAAGIKATNIGAVITIQQPGALGNSTVLSANLSGGATETITFAPSNGHMSGGAGVFSGQLAGGSGPIIPVQNFSFHYNGTVLNFWYGKPVPVGDDLVLKMVQQGMPII